MSNSKLATYTNISSKSSSRNGNKIERIIVHHMACVSTGKSCCDAHKNSTRQVSANYYIGKNGDIAQGVDESRRAWTSGSFDADGKAVTIEVSNSVNGNPYGGDGWKVSDASFDALVELCADICKRNDIKELTFTKNKTKDTLSGHKQWDSTVCPGDYLYGKFPELCERVNEILNPKPKTKTTYFVQVGAFSTKKLAEDYAKKLEKDGYKATIKTETKEVK